MKIFNTFIIVSLFCFSSEMQGQLGFCQGNSGDPIFTEDFGTGTANGPALPSGTTTYTYSNDTPYDGSYTISSYTAYFDWFNTTDHTPNDVNGRAFIVNASYTAGEFYRTTINGLCENTSYEFSSWLMNLLPTAGCAGNGIPINVKFQIWDSTDTFLLAEGDTEDIFSNNSPIWEQYALLFQTQPGQSSVILKMLNNGGGGCGNDLAIDDIVFRSCGDLITVTDDQNETSIAACEDDGAVSAIISASPDYSIYSTHYYQWQESSDGVNWVDIPGETTDTYSTPPVSSTYFYRVKVAEDLINISNNLCNVVSETFEILMVSTPAAPASDGDVAVCESAENVALTVSVPPGITVNWYDASSGGTLLAENSTTLFVDYAGTFFAEAVPLSANCPSDTRTAVTLELYPLPVVVDETLNFCENSNIRLQSNVQNVSYLWNTGETTADIVVSQPGTYTVEVTDFRGCSNIKTIILNQIDQPIIDLISSNDYEIHVSTLNSGDFEFSLDGSLYQDSPIFTNIKGGSYTIYVRNKFNCIPVSTQYIHMVIPKFFTPNGDSINDVFEIEGLETFTDYEIRLFDRYGTLLKTAYNTSLSWDGTFNTRMLPSGDYWYAIRFADTIIKGHVALKR